jgi:hypothetical protein
VRVKSFLASGVSLKSMYPQERFELEKAVADLRGVSQRVGRLIPHANGPVRESLITIKRESEAAIKYYKSLLPALPGREAPEVVARAAEAACVPIGGVGLVVPGFVLEQASGKAQ